jgi:hypothetical protein
VFEKIARPYPFVGSAKRVRFAADGAFSFEPAAGHDIRG